MARNTSETADRLYSQIHAIASVAMLNERVGHTLQPTALAHEVFIRLSESRKSWESDEAFVSAVAVSIRRTLVDHARSHMAKRRPPRDSRRDVDIDAMAAEPDTLLELHDLLDRLAKRDQDVARAVELRVFAGLTVEEIAGLLELSERTIVRYQAAARAWIRSELIGSEG